MTPNTITFQDSNATWVMRITADRRIEVNEGVEVTEAAQKVLDAMQHLLKPRTWAGLTEEEFIYFCSYVRPDVLSEIEDTFRSKND